MTIALKGTMRYLIVAYAFLLFLNSVAAAKCNADNCARAATGTLSGLQSQRLAACSSYQQCTVTPASGGNPATTNCPTSTPSFASACSGTSRYQSACSCAGITQTFVTSGVSTTSTASSSSSSFSTSTVPSSTSGISSATTTCPITETTTATTTETSTSTTTEISTSTIISPVTTTNTVTSCIDTSTTTTTETTTTTAISTTTESTTITTTATDTSTVTSTTTVVVTTTVPADPVPSAPRYFALQLVDGTYSGDFVVLYPFADESNPNTFFSINSDDINTAQSFEFSNGHLERLGYTAAVPSDQVSVTNQDGAGVLGVDGETDGYSALDCTSVPDPTDPPGSFSLQCSLGNLPMVLSVCYPAISGLTPPDPDHDYYLYIRIGAVVPQGCDEATFRLIESS